VKSRLVTRKTIIGVVAVDVGVGSCAIGMKVHPMKAALMLRPECKSSALSREKVGICDKDLRDNWYSGLVAGVPVLVSTDGVHLNVLNVVVVVTVNGQMNGTYLVLVRTSCAGCCRYCQ
jgi:hypothetical protein